MVLTIDKKIGGLLLLMVLVGVTNLLIIYYYQSMQTYDSHIVNAAGRQRMLSQKIAKLAMSVASGHEGDRRPLAEVVALYGSSLESLENGGKVMDKLLPPAPPVMRWLFESNRSLWEPFKKNAEIVIKEERENSYFWEAVSYITEEDDELLTKTDRVVSAYDTLPDSSEFIHEINVAGRQRMLTQKMIRYALALAVKGEGEVTHKWEEPEKEIHEKLQEVLELYDNSFLTLYEGGVSSPWGRKVKLPPGRVYEALDKLEETWYYFKAELEIILRESRDNPEFVSATKYIKNNNASLLEISDRITAEYTRIFGDKVTDLITLVFFMVGVDLLIFLIGYFMAYQLSQPIKELSRSALRIGKGDFEHRIAIPGGEDEIRDLALAFDGMVRDLQKTTVSKDYVNNIIESMIDTLMVADPDGKIITVNGAACGLLGYGEEELIGLRVEKIMGDKPFNGKSFREILQAGYHSGEVSYQTREGMKIPMLFSGSAMRDKQDRLIGMVQIAQDITERKRMEQQLQKYAARLEQINEDLKIFAFTVSHDLRAPLVNIKGFAGELRSSLKEVDSALDQVHLEGTEKEVVFQALKEDIPEALRFIDSSASRMDSLISAVLKLSRLDRRELRWEPIDMEALVRDTLKTLAHQLEERQVKLSLASLPAVTADRTSMEQIMGNILDNAVKYLDPGRPGKIEITGESGLEETVFHVRDNGWGIDRKDFSRIFELFRRVGRQDVPGEGMGLSYVQTLVRRHGGRIWCQSEPGKETTFTFTISNHLSRGDINV